MSVYVVIYELNKEEVQEALTLYNIIENIKAKDPATLLN